MGWISFAEYAPPLAKVEHHKWVDIKWHRPMSGHVMSPIGSLDELIHNSLALTVSSPVKFMCQLWSLQFVQFQLHLVFAVPYLNFQLFIITSYYSVLLKCKMTLKGPLNRLEIYKLFLLQLVVHVILFIPKMQKSTQLRALYNFENCPVNSPGTSSLLEKGRMKNPQRWNPGERPGSAYPVIRN